MTNPGMRTTTAPTAPRDPGPDNTHPWQVTTTAQAVLSIVVGIVAVRWPGITVGSLVLLFVIYALAAAAAALFSTFTPTGRTRAAHLALALWHLLSAVVMLAWPGLTVTVLVFLIAIWSLSSGILEITSAVTERHTTRRVAHHTISGVISITLAVVLLLDPDAGAISLVQVFGFFAIVTGLAALVTLLRSASAVGDAG